MDGDSDESNEVKFSWRTLEILHGLMLAAAIVLFAVLSALAWKARQELVSSSLLVNQNLKIVGGAATNLEKTLREEHAAIQDQLTATSEAMKRINEVASAARVAIAHTDNSLNGRGGVLPATAKLVSDQDVAIQALEAQAAAVIADLALTVKQSQAVMWNLNEVAENAAALTADPSIRESLQKLDDALAKANLILASLDSMAASGNRDALMLEAKLRQALKPAALAKRIFMQALGLAVPAVQIAAAVK